MWDRIKVALSLLMVSGIKKIVYYITKALELCSKINEIADVGNGTAASWSRIFAPNLYSTSTVNKQADFRFAPRKKWVFEDWFTKWLEIF